MNRVAWRNVPWGFIGAIVLIVGVEKTIASKITSVTTEVASCWSFAAKAASREAAHSEILGFGDSLMKYGFQPKVIEAQTGRTAYNLAAYGGPPSRDYLLLKRVLDAGGKPAALVVCFQVVHLGSGPRFHVRHFAESVTPSEALDLSWYSRDPGLFAWLMLSRVVPSIRTRFEIRGNAMTALNGQGIDWTNLYYPFRRNWNQARGAHVHPEEPHAPDDEIAAKARAKELYAGHFDDLSDQHPVHEQYIRRFLDLAAERKIPVIWLIPPMLPAIEERHHEVGLSDLTTQLSRRMQEAYPNLIVVDGRHQGYDAQAFCPDAVHLNRRGANALSRDLAAIIRHHFSESTTVQSWVSLLPYRPGSLDTDLEDLTRSRTVLREAKAVRR